MFETETKQGGTGEKEKRWRRTMEITREREIILSIFIGRPWKGQYCVISVTSEDVACRAATVVVLHGDVA